MAEPHPDWPPIAFETIAIFAAAPVTREDLVVIRSLMRDLAGSPDLLARARVLELEAQRSLGGPSSGRSAPPMRSARPAAQRAML